MDVGMLRIHRGTPDGVPKDGRAIDWWPDDEIEEGGGGDGGHGIDGLARFLIWLVIILIFGIVAASILLARAFL